MSTPTNHRKATLVTTILSYVLPVIIVFVALILSMNGLAQAQNNAANEDSANSGITVITGHTPTIAQAVPTIDYVSNVVMVSGSAGSNL